MPEQEGSPAEETKVQETGYDFELSGDTLKPTSQTLEHQRGVREANPNVSPSVFDPQIDEPDKDQAA